MCYFSVMASGAGVRMAVAFSVIALGCGSTSGDPSCPSGKLCNSGKPSGPVYGLRADGTVDITTTEVWPNRQPESAPLSADELARACAALAACVEVEPPDVGTVEDSRRLLLAICIKPEQSYFWEERAVPTIKKNERWSFEARAILAAGGDCQAVLAVSTERAAEITCEEVGCWWASKSLPIPEVTCAGDVATLQTAGRTITRDCSRAFATCANESPTGCTDRAPVACEHPAKDRCDGSVRLGCDGTGRVSFHDCSRVPGGTCADTADGPGCVYPNDSTCPAVPYGCNGSMLSLCVLGTAVELDCIALGFAGCTSGVCVAG